MSKKFSVHIHRYDTAKNPVSYVQTYELKYHSSQTVLEVLSEIHNSQDDSLSFRSSCEAAKCGSCAVEVNGKSVLACKTIVDGNNLEIKPLPSFPVVKDLIVDRERYEKGYVQMVSYDRNITRPEKSEAALSESEIDYANLSCCIGCLICNSACPVGAQMDDKFPSPAVITEVLSSGVRTEKEGRLQAPIEGNIDYCSLCLNCHVACPSGVALNRINAQAKNAFVKAKGRGLRDWMLGRAELMGKMGSLSPSLSNSLLKNSMIRTGMETTLGINKKVPMVPFAKSLKTWLKKRPKSGIKLKAPLRKVVYFAGCYTHYNDTDPGKDAIKVLEHLGFEVQVPDQNCCGLPLLSSGDMDTARALAKTNIASFQKWCDKGYDIIASCTSCSLMLKHEYTEVLGIENAIDIAEHTHDLGQYLSQLIDSKEVELHLNPVPLVTAYQTPCHLKTQKIGLPLIDILKNIPEFKVDIMNATCCGQSGSYGFKTEKYKISKDVSQHLSESLSRLKPELALSECGPCQLRMNGVSGLPVAHPISILCRSLIPSGS